MQQPIQMFTSGNVLPADDLGMATTDLKWNDKTSKFRFVVSKQDTIDASDRFYFTIVEQIKSNPGGLIKGCYVQLGNGRNGTRIVRGLIELSREIKKGDWVKYVKQNGANPGKMTKSEYPFHGTVEQMRKDTYIREAIHYQQ